MPINPPSKTHRPYTLVLAGGGARGFAHAGVLRALEAEGYHPDAVVGVSMGAVIGVTYALRTDWYTAVLKMNTGAFPGPLHIRPEKPARIRDRWSAWVGRARVIQDMVYGWGPGVRALGAGQRLLQNLTEGRSLEDGRIPLAVSTTDLYSGQRYVLRAGSAADALYASAALAGILPPLRQDGRLLADGAYADIAPIDVARGFGNPVVIAIDPGQDLGSTDIRNGYQALMRAMEICHMRHADARFAEADLVLRPIFLRTIDTLDFDARRECIAAGMHAVRQHRSELGHLLRQEHGSTIQHRLPSSIKNATHTEAQDGVVR
ncbi:MAG: patatin-like phospholipase family protein [Bacteroidetes bacterium]|nr:patatin-like phospholipase family protein [Bacteroidota bacterium]